MLWLLAIVPLAGAAAIAVTHVRRRSSLGVLACLVLASTLALAASAVVGDWSGTSTWNGLLRLRAALTPLSALVAVLVPAVALPVLGYAAMHEEARGLARLVALLLAFVGAMELLVIADDLLTVLIGWELVGACSWALIGHEWRDIANPRSGVYAFLMTRAGDLGMFAAAMAAFAGAGSFAYADLARLDSGTLQVCAFGLLLSAAAKSGQLPFSPWLFRAMDGPTSVSALLHAATMVAAGAFLLARVHPLLDRVDWFGPTAIAIGAATALAGGVVALLQCHAKKLLAASTSAQFGLMFVAIGAGAPVLAMLHLVAHAFFKALLFLCAGVAGERAGGYALAGMRLARALPFVASTSAVGALALAGVPPLGAAWTKEAIVTAAGQVGVLWALVVVVAGGLSAAYAARFQWLAFGWAERGGEDGAEEAGERLSPGGPPGTVLAALTALAVASLLLSILWLPAPREVALEWLGAALPSPVRWEFAASLLAVGVGVLGGRWLALRRPALGESAAAATAADWLQLPMLLHKLVTAPFEALARHAGRFDDRVIDALPRAFGRWARRGARHSARGDRVVVDRIVRASARFVERAAVAGDRFGEFVVDGLPEGAARLVGLGGEDAQRLQSGLSHRYFAIIAIGTALLFAALLMGT